GERGVGRAVFLRLLVDALVGGDPLQAVRAGGGVEGDEAGEEEGRDQAGDQEAAVGAVRGGGLGLAGGGRGVDQFAVDPELEGGGQGALDAVDEVGAYGEDRA